MNKNTECAALTITLTALWLVIETCPPTNYITMGMAHVLFGVALAMLGWNLGQIIFEKD